MTKQEIKTTIQDLKDGLNSKFTPEQFKPRMEEKIKELEAKLSAMDKPTSTPTRDPEPSKKMDSFKMPETKSELRKHLEVPEGKEPKVVKITPPSPPVEKKRGVPLPKEKQKQYPEDEDDYCAKVIAQAKERRKKAKERANAPQKTEATKNKEKLEKVFDNVKERAETEDVSKSELQKLIAETESLLKFLKRKLASL